jgi:hypothetical protein
MSTLAARHSLILPGEAKMRRRLGWSCCAGGCSSLFSLFSRTTAKVTVWLLLDDRFWWQNISAARYPKSITRLAVKPDFFWEGDPCKAMSGYSTIYRVYIKYSPVILEVI